MTQIFQSIKQNEERIEAMLKDIYSMQEKHSQKKFEIEQVKIQKANEKQEHLNNMDLVRAKLEA